MRLYVLLTSLMLTACAPARFDTAQSTSLVLPPVIPYEQEFLNTAADEAEAGQCRAHVELGKDYKVTRDKLRIAKKAMEKK